MNVGCFVVRIDIFDGARHILNEARCLVGMADNKKEPTQVQTKDSKVTALSPFT